MNVCMRTIDHSNLSCLLQLQSNVSIQWKSFLLKHIFFHSKGNTPSKKPTFLHSNEECLSKLMRHDMFEGEFNLCTVHFNQLNKFLYFQSMEKLLDVNAWKQNIYRQHMEMCKNVIINGKRIENQKKYKWSTHIYVCVGYKWFKTYNRKSIGCLLKLCW